MKKSIFTSFPVLGIATAMFLFINMQISTFAENNKNVYVASDSQNKGASASAAQLNSQKKEADNINLKHKGKSKSENSNSSSSPNAKSSYASNYTNGLNAEVSPQTGQLSIDISNIKLPGIVSDMDIDFGINNNSLGTSPEYQFENVPSFGDGWSFDLPYIAVSPSISDQPDPEDKILSIDGKTFELDPNYPSGLRYVLKDSTLATFINPLQLSSVPTGYESQYTYKYSTYSGYSYYFDNGGKLIAREDSYGNFIYYQYQLPDPSQTLANNGPIQITDSYGQQIKISYLSNEVDVTMPDQRVAKYIFNSLDNTITIQNLNGTEESINYQTNPQQVTTITYSDGGTVAYNYNDIMPYSYSGATMFFGAVQSVTSNPNTTGVPSSTVTYNYTINGQNDYTGDGELFGYNNASDNLLESGDNSYTYTTEISTSYTDVLTNELQTIVQDNTYNSQHLLIESTKYFNDPNKINPSWDQKISYEGGAGVNSNIVPFSSESPNYNLPNKVITTLYATGNSLTKNINSSPVVLSTTSTLLTTYNDLGQPLSAERYDNGYSSTATPSYTDIKTYLPTSYDASTNSYVGDGLLQSETVTYSTDESATQQASTVINYNDSYTWNNGAVTSSTATKSIAGQPCVLTTTINFDSNGRALNTSYRSNATGIMDYSTSSFAYNLTGNVLTTTSTDMLSNSVTETSDIRNGFVLSNSLKNSSSNGADEQINYTYPSYTLNGVTTQGLISTQTSPDGSTVTTDASIPNQITTTYSNGYQTSEIDDGLGRPISESDNMTSSGPVAFSSTNQGKILSTFTYDEHGNKTSETDYIYKNINEFTKETSFFEYDDWMDSLSEATDYLGNTTSSNISVDPSSGNLAVSSSVNGNLISTSYDTINGEHLGNTNNIYDKSSSSIYNGLQEQIQSSVYDTNTPKNPLSTASYVYDINNQMVSMQMSTQDNAKGITSYYFRGLFGNLIQRTTIFNGLPPGVYSSPGSNNTIVGEVNSYNCIGQLIETTNQRGQKQDFTYDQYGNLASKTDYEGNKYTYTYDDMNNLIEEDLNSVKLITYTYFAGNLASMNAGKLESETLYASDGKTIQDQITYAYDAMGNLNKETMLDNKSMSMNYDLSGRLVSSTDYNNETTTYTYVTGTSNIASISNSDMGEVDYTYYSKSDSPYFGSGDTIETMSIYNSSKTLIQTVSYLYYLPSDLLKSTPAAKNNSLKIESITTANSDNSTVSTVAYTYNTFGNIATTTKTTKGTYQNSSGTSQSILYSNNDFNNEEVYTYNDMNQLLDDTVYNLNSSYLQADKIYSTDYTYNLNSDIHSKIVSTYKGDGTVTPTSTTTYVYAYNSVDEMKCMIVTPSTGTSTGETFLYDLNGNLTTISDLEGNVLQKFYFNSLNQLAEYKNRENGKKPQYVYEYTYYVNGERKSKEQTANPDYNKSIPLV